MSQQKDPDTEEYRKLLSEKEVHTKRIQQLTEEIGRLKAEIARYMEQTSSCIQHLDSLEVCFCSLCDPLSAS